MAKKPSDYSDMLDRRQFVTIAGVSGAAALAGCGGDGGNGGNEGTSSTDGGNDGGGGDGGDGGDGGSQVYDAALDDISFLIPKNIQYNPFNPNKYSQVAFYMLSDDFAQYDFSSNEFVNYGISDWQFDAKKATLTVRDGLTWFDGSPVTSKDVVTQFRLQKHMGNSLWKYAESVEATDDKTVVVHLQEKTNPKIVQFTIANNWLRIPDSVYGDYLKKIENADGEEAKNKAIAELTDFAPTDPMGCGVFEKDSADKQQLTLTRNADHPDAGNVNFEKWRLNYTGGNQSSWQALLSNTVDAAYSLFTPPKIVNQLPGNWNEGLFPAYWGYGITPNYNEEPLNKREFRQGLMYVLNRQQVVDNAGPRTKVTPKIPTGVAAEVQDQYLGDEMDSYESYGVDETMTSEAEAKFEAAGLTKSGGKWMYDGSQVSLPVLVPSGWSDWVTAAQTVTDQLSSFGFDSSMVSKDFGTVLSDWANGNFTLASFYWLPGGARSAYPFYPLSHQLTPDFAASGNSISWGFEGTEEITVPSRTGSGETTVNVQEQTRALAQTTDSAKAQDMIKELAWVANQELTMLPLASKQNQTWISSKGWDVPEKDSGAYMVQYASTWLPKTGEMKYSGN